MLTEEEIERYARHIIIRDIGGPGQVALKSARILVIGAGGLGSPALMYLAAAGIGTIGIADDDLVSLSNLQRQVIHETQDIGCAKVESAARRVAALNPNVAVRCHHVRLDASNVMDLLKQYDLVIDGSDNFETRYLVSDACYFAAKPLVMGTLGVFEGSITTIRAHDRNSDGEFNPTFRCLFPEAPPLGMVPTCAEAGVLGALAGLVGSMIALEAIREIVRFGEGLVGRLMLIDTYTMRFQTIGYARDPSNPLNGQLPSMFDLTHHVRD